MSEVIENYIRSNQGMSEKDAFAGFLEQDRIKTWIGTDSARRERLEREFARVWDSLHPPMTTSRHGTSVKTPKPAAEKKSIAVEVVRPAAPVQAPQTQALDMGPPRKLQVLCPTCSQHDVWVHNAVIKCRHCGHAYDDMLALIPVRPVGPFSFLFGEGAAGVLTAAAVVAGLIVLYGVFRWL